MSGDPDDVLGKADALMHRHRSFVAGATPQGTADDVPVLTDEVSLESEAAGAAEAAARQRLGDVLNRLEPEIALAVEAWLAAELPQLVARELGALGPRLLQAANHSLQQALLPEIARLIQAVERESPRDAQ